MTTHAPTELNMVLTLTTKQSVSA